jgi:hypothetical protein
MTTDTRRADLERNLAIAEQSGYSYVADNNRRLLAALDAREAAPVVAPTLVERAQMLRRLLWAWLPEELIAEDDGQAIALALLEQVREAGQMLDNWSGRLIRVASDNGATNPAIGAAVGVGKERIRRRLLKEPTA